MSSITVDSQIIAESELTFVPRLNEKSTQSTCDMEKSHKKNKMNSALRGVSDVEKQINST
jgi:hypothetical protein